MQRVAVADGVLAYVVDLCRATRVSPSLELGASPRGATALLAAAKAWAWLTGRDYVTPDDVKALARPTLRHRVRLRAEAELEGVTADAVLDSRAGHRARPRDDRRHAGRALPRVTWRPAAVVAAGTACSRWPASRRRRGRRGWLWLGAAALLVVVAIAVPRGRLGAAPPRR